MDISHDGGSVSMAHSPCPAPYGGARIAAVGMVTEREADIACLRDMGRQAVATWERMGLQLREGFDPRLAQAQMATGRLAREVIAQKTQMAEGAALGLRAARAASVVRAAQQREETAKMFAARRMVEARIVVAAEAGGDAGRLRVARDRWLEGAEAGEMLGWSTVHGLVLAACRHLEIGAGEEGWRENEVSNAWADAGVRLDEGL